MYVHTFYLMKLHNRCIHVLGLLTSDLQETQGDRPWQSLCIQYYRTVYIGSSELCVCARTNPISFLLHMGHVML